MDHTHFRKNLKLINRSRVSLNVAYPVEILPYHLRAKGLTILNLSISLSLFFGQYVNPIGIENLGWKFYIVYEVWLVIEVRSSYNMASYTLQLGSTDTN
jgi:hypothetical protein